MRHFPNWLANKLITHFGNWLYGLHLTDMDTCYKVFKADLLKGLSLHCDRFALDAEVTALLAKKRVKIVEMPTGYRGRSIREGKKIKARDFFAVIFTLVRGLFVKV